MGQFLSKLRNDEPIPRYRGWTSQERDAFLSDLNDQPEPEEEGICHRLKRIIPSPVKLLWITDTVFPLLMLYLETIFDNFELDVEQPMFEKTDVQFILPITYLIEFCTGCILQVDAYVQNMEVNMYSLLCFIYGADVVVCGNAVFMGCLTTITNLVGLHDLTVFETVRFFYAAWAAMYRFLRSNQMSKKLHKLQQDYERKKKIQLCRGLRRRGAIRRKMK